MLGRVLLVGLLASGAVVRLASAQPSSDAPGAAREAFAQGEEAVHAERYESALGHFRRARELSGRAAIGFNIGFCLERLGRHREAMLEYERVAALPDLAEATRERARAQVAAARAELGALEIEGEPVGAEVWLDGERLCAVPCRLEVDPGAHVVSARADERRVDADVVAARGEVREVRLTLPPDDSAAAAADGTSSTGPARATDPRDRTDPVIVEESAGGDLVGPLGWIGLAAAGLGAAGVVGFGVRTLDLEAQYAGAPSAALRDEGLVMQVSANVSIGLTALGAILFFVDLLFVE